MSGRLVVRYGVASGGISVRVTFGSVLRRMRVVLSWRVCAPFSKAFPISALVSSQKITMLSPFSASKTHSIAFLAASLASIE